MKISNKVKMIACFVLGVMSLALGFAYSTSGNTQSATTNIVIGVFLLYGGSQFKNRNGR